MKRNVNLFYVTLVAAALAVASFTAGALAKSTPKRGESPEETYKELKPYVDALSLIQEKYVDEDKTQAKKLIEGSLTGMVNTLDPFSQYMGADEFKEMQTETSGEFGGLGIEIAIKDDRLTVITPIDGTPAEKAGVKAGDKIVKIGSEKTDGLSINECVKRLRGKIGTPVTISLVREGMSEPFEVTIVRAAIKIESVRSYRLPHDIGYVRLNEFIRGTSDDAEKALSDLEKDGPLKGLVLDLRNDPGGLLDEAVNTSDLFAEKGATIVSTRGRDPRQNYAYRATGRRKFGKRPVVVLINEGSASGSEIVAGCLKDLKIGLLLGTKSFGKGSVQTIFPLEDSGGAALRLTTAKYYTPSGVCIHGIGIEPDLELKGTELTDSTLKAYTGKRIQEYAKVLLQKTAAPKEGERLPEESLKGFYAYCASKDKKVDPDDLAKNADQLENSLIVEMVSDASGEKEARRIAVLRDPQVLAAEEIVLNKGKLTPKWAAHEAKVKKDKAEKDKLAKATPTPDDNE